MAIVATTKTPAARRHPLAVTAARLEQAASDYPQLWDTVERAAIERVTRKLRRAAAQIEEGVRV